MTLENVKQIKVWVVWTNTDLTEGRGSQYPVCVCKLLATAIRRSKRIGVQGGDGSIDERLAYEINMHLYVPGIIDDGTLEDEKTQKQIDAKNAAKERALKLGLSPDDIKMLSSE